MAYPRVRLTFNKSVHAPLSIGPFLRPSNSINLIPPGVTGVPSSREGGDGACTKHVKCRLTRASALGGAVCPDEAAEEWIDAKSEVVSRALARSKGVLSAGMSKMFETG